MGKNSFLFENVLFFLPTLQLVLVNDLHRVDLARVFLPDDGHFSEASYCSQPEDVEGFEVNAADRLEVVGFEIEVFREDFERDARPRERVVEVDVSLDGAETSDGPHVEVGCLELRLQVRVEEPVDSQLVANAAWRNHLDMLSCSTVSYPEDAVCWLR